MALLETKNLTIQFGGHTAVDHVSFSLPEKEFKSVIGPNGAGKTTFFNLLSGELKPTEGEVYYKGKSLNKVSAVERTRRGIGRSFQITNVFPNLTVFENVRLAVQSKEKVRYPFWKSTRSYHGLAEKTHELLEQVLLDNKAHMIAAQLSHGEKRKLEIAMLLALDTEVLLLDEPTAGMSLEEVPAILNVIRSIKDQGDKTILLIEHKMDMILDLSDSIMVLFNGQLLADGTPEDIMQNETVQQAYLGGYEDGKSVRNA
ncbi:ABC transporter ATP-binding protein [Jeotgalibacillus terrae]|uniref:ABC transporter ATP-binding protein n=1 Tax=Jeotgalibacillus terrae TaxID=587735 RepID=A0ABW5ZLF1_9BACL|nr:ABC transporter ATP-binding protein [Jeotgalibacillus terrae]MBM7579679.1 branched-chain amino acid transport system ATP-binding protein [Jeotgalibacillus terrae]